MVGRFVVDYLTKKYGEPRGKIVELAGLKGVEGEINRREGAHEVWQAYPKIEVVTEAVANWSQSQGKDRMTEILSALPQIDIVYGRNDPMAVGAWLAAHERGREKEMIFVGVDGVPGEAGGVSKVREGVLSATCIYPALRGQGRGDRHKDFTRIRVCSREAVHDFVGADYAGECRPVHEMTPFLSEKSCICRPSVGSEY